MATGKKAPQKGGFRQIRLREGGTLDEVCIDGCSFHLEQMDDDSYWVGISRGNERVHINFWTGSGSRKGAAIHARVLDEGVGCDIVRQTATGYVPVTLAEAKAAGYEGIDASMAEVADAV